MCLSRFCRFNNSLRNETQYLNGFKAVKVNSCYNDFIQVFLPQGKPLQKSNFYKISFILRNHLFMYFHSSLITCPACCYKRTVVHTKCYFRRLYFMVLS